MQQVVAAGACFGRRRPGVAGDEECWNFEGAAQALDRINTSDPSRQVIVADDQIGATARFARGKAR